MELKVGDKVKYLDAVGGGVITGFQGKDKVLVLEEDGFEMPVLKRQCVVVNDEKPMAPVRPVTIPMAETRRQEVPAPSQPKVKPTGTISSTLMTGGPEDIDLSLAFLPEDGQPFNEAAIECYLINDSPYTLLFNYASVSGKAWQSRQSGELEPNSKLFLESFDRNLLNEIDKVCLQGLLFRKEQFYSWQNPVSVELRLDTVKFYKLHCFKENDYFEDDALVFPVMQHGVPVRELLVTSEELTNALHEKERPLKNGDQKSQPLTNRKKLIEVDLHSASLLDSTAGMSNGDVLNYQLDVFRKTMDEHRNVKGQKIVFIHGKGEGVLHAALLKELATKYKGCIWQDASFKEYGFGATQVTIR